MKCRYACHSPEHQIARRQFLGGLAAGAGAVVGGLGVMARPAVAQQLAKDQKRVIVIFMSGGLSQFESWDPKPKTDTGGPFRAIPTSVPGTHICELLPMTAQQMHRLAIVRSVNNNTNGHDRGRYRMEHGRDRRPGVKLPHLGVVAARALAPESTGLPDNGLPGHIRIANGGGGRSNDSAYLGPKYASMVLGNGNPPKNSARPKSLTEAADLSRNEFRRQASDRFTARRRTAETDAYTHNYEQALQLMRQRHIFDMSQEPANVQERYGKSNLGRHFLLARRLVENGITCVQVSHAGYDTHNENFNFHLEQLGEFDRPFSALVSDLGDRGLLESTLIVVMSEFGRSPKINRKYGRDHWGKSWSVVLGGGRIQPGAVIGKTNKNGTAVTDREVDHAQLFHTYLQGISLDSHVPFDIGSRPVPMADPACEGIQELIV